MVHTSTTRAAAKAAAATLYLALIPSTSQPSMVAYSIATSWIAAHTCPQCSPKNEAHACLHTSSRMAPCNAPQCRPYDFNLTAFSQTYSFALMPDSAWPHPDSHALQLCQGSCSTFSLTLEAASCPITPATEACPKLHNSSIYASGPAICAPGLASYPKCSACRPMTSCAPLLAHPLQVTASPLSSHEPIASREVVGVSVAPSSVSAAAVPPPRCRQGCHQASAACDEHHNI